MACDNDNNYDNPILPEELLIEVFLRSSVECVLRVKCVCKHWYGLIKNHSFANKHLQYQKNKKMHRLLLQTGYFDQENRINNYAVLDDQTQSYTPLQNLYTTYHLTMEGPVNGLFCLYNEHDRVVLWNPALKDFKLLPIPPPPSLPHRTSFYGRVGFGIDPLTNNYKVVLIRYFSDSRGLIRRDPVVNLITNVWKPFDLGNFRLHDSLTKNLSSSFLNGICHWWCGGEVLAFDLSNESFRLIPGPKFPFYHSCFFSNIGVYEERVAVWHRDNLSVFFWVMLEEGIWMKQLSLRPHPDLFLWPCGFWNNKGPLLLFDGLDSYDELQMVLYDIKSRELKKVGPKGMIRGFQAWVYFESLVSLDGGTNFDEDMVSNFLDGRPFDVGRGPRRSSRLAGLDASMTMSEESFFHRLYKKRKSK